MQSKIVVDTSFIIHSTIPTETKYKNCIQFLSQNEYNFIAPEILLIECASYYIRILKHSQKQIYEHIENIKNFVDIHGNYSKVDHVIDIICEYKTRGADSIFVRLAAKNQCQLLTCDQDQAKKYQNSILI